MSGAKTPGQSPTLFSICLNPITFYLPELLYHLIVVSIQSELKKEVQRFFLNGTFRCFPLLAKQRTNQPECDVLLNVFALLSAKNASPATIAVVMDIAESLATTEDFVASETEKELSVNGCVFPQPEEGALVTAG